MSSDTELPDDSSLRYWKTVLATLPPEKRDVAWEFYLNRLAGGNGSDTLSALILLLEANGIFLQQLPERYHGELISPLRADLVTFQDRISRHEIHQREIAVALEGVSRQNAGASAQALTMVATVEGSLRAAATSVDALTVVEGVRKQIMEGAVVPMMRKMEALATQTTRIDEATKSAHDAVETWRRVHLGGIVLSGWSIGLLVFVTLFLFGWSRLERNAEHQLTLLRDQLTANLRENQETLRKLAESGVSMRIVPVADSDGKAKQDALALIVEPAEGADFDTRNGQKRGVVYLQPARKNRMSFSILR